MLSCPRYTPPRAPPRVPALQRDAVRLSEERAADVLRRRVPKALVTPGWAPAIPDDEAVRGITHDTDRMATPSGVGLEGVQLPLGSRCVVPSGVDREPGQNGTLGGKPILPLLQVLLEVEVAGNLSLSRG